MDITTKNKIRSGFVKERNDHKMMKARTYQGRSPSQLITLNVTNLPQGAVTSPYLLRRARIQTITRQQRRRRRRVDALTLSGYRDALKVSILAVICFPPIGLVAMAFSIKAYLLVKRQDNAGAGRAANVAACLGIVSILLGVPFWILLGVPLWLLFFAALCRIIS